MIEIALKPKNRIFHHILFWVGYMAFYTLFWGSHEGNYWDQFLQLLILLPWKIIPTYITLYFLMPKYLYPKKMLVYAILSLILASIMALADRYATWTYIYPRFYPNEDYHEPPLWYFPKILNSLIRVYTPVFVAMAIKLQRFYYQNDQIKKNLGKEKIETELKFLKAQIHPHFLFNTLNSIYSLSLKKSTETPDAVLRLSKFLDYMLYECNDRSITIERELEQLMNLIELEKLRYGEDLTISTNLINDSQESLIPPLLLLPFVENAFKHGADSLISDSWINIDLRLQNQQLQFMVENSKATSQTNENLDTDKNIGLKNVKRRLSLFYPDKHELKILEEDDSFLIKLEIDLSGLS